MRKRTRSRTLALRGLRHLDRKLRGLRDGQEHPGKDGSRFRGFPKKLNTPTALRDRGFFLGAGAPEGFREEADLAVAFLAEDSELEPQGGFALPEIGDELGGGAPEILDGSALRLGLGNFLEEILLWQVLGQDAVGVGGEWLDIPVVGSDALLRFGLVFQDLLLSGSWNSSLYLRRFCSKSNISGEPRFPAIINAYG